MGYIISEYYLQVKGSYVMMGHLISIATDNKEKKRSVLKEFKLMVSFSYRLLSDLEGETVKDLPLVSLKNDIKS